MCVAGAWIPRARGEPTFRHGHVFGYEEPLMDDCACCSPEHNGALRGCYDALCSSFLCFYWRVYVPWLVCGTAGLCVVFSFFSSALLMPVSFCLLHTPAPSPALAWSLSFRSYSLPSLRLVPNEASLLPPGLPASSRLPPGPTSGFDLIIVFFQRIPSPHTYRKSSLSFCCSVFSENLNMLFWAFTWDSEL